MKFPLKKINMKELKGFRVELFFVVIGILLLILPGMISLETEREDKVIKSTDNGSESKVLYMNKSYAENESERLKTFLEGIKGVGSAEVLIYVDSSLKTVHAGENQSVKENTDESDSNGGKRVNTSTDERFEYKVIKDEHGNESLVRVYDQYPEIRGVLISAEGADSNVIRETIIDAVSKLYDIPVHKISVVKKVSVN